MIEMQKIALSTLLVQKPGMIVSDMDGDKVMMSIENGKYYNLGTIGGVIWDLLESPISMTAIIVSLMNDYDVGYNECEEEVMSFLGHLYNEGLIQVRDEIKL